MSSEVASFRKGESLTANAWTGRCDLDVRPALLVRNGAGWPPYVVVRRSKWASNVNEAQFFTKSNEIHAKAWYRDH